MLDCQSKGETDSPTETERLFGSKRRLENVSEEKGERKREREIVGGRG
jgi:hypothetical protein